MAKIDDAIYHMIAVVPGWGGGRYVRQLERLLTIHDEQKAIRTFVEIMKKIEEDDAVRWTARQTGVVLQQAGMISIGDVPKGVAALLTDEEVSV